jgi:polysaccharide chain length determinant protein (PEP-CTERM system associated)
MDLFANGFSLTLLLDMLRRRLWIAVSLFSVVVTVAASMVAFLPNVYTASALILVEGQQIPPDFVRSTVTLSVERRIETVSQEILGRAKLAELVTQFGLYQDLKEKGASDEIIAAAMRRDIGVEIKGRGGSGDAVAFSVSYTNPDQQKVMEITNILASYYIEGNLKVREQQAIGTSQFLQNELEEVKQKLENHEEQVKRYKELHLEELPEQRDANLATLAVLQRKMESLSEELAVARERRSSLIQQTAVVTPRVSQGNRDAESDENLPLDVLKGRLAALKVRFSDKHPDVRHLQELIGALEKQQNGLSEDADPGAMRSSFDREKAAVDAQIQHITDELSKVRQEMNVYQQRVENAPKRELEMQTITRDYNSTRTQYESLLKRLQEASLADSLEQRQKAERFRLLEPAAYPTTSVAPKRKMLLLLGLMGGLGAAVGGVLLREILDPSFHRVDDLKAFVKMPVLVSIPRLVTKADQWRQRRLQCLGVVALAVSLVLLVGASYWIAAGNEALVRSLVR